MICRKLYTKWMAKTQREKIRQILERVKVSGTTLDVGSGPGFLEERIFAIALDNNPEYLKKFSGPRVLASGDEMPFKSRRFHTVFCIDTIHLLKNPDELVRVLSPKGKLIVTLPCNKWNCERKLKELTDKFHGLIPKESFIVKTESEWDAVMVFATQGP
ncbi:MAG: class I SAM-dependent methyltransferase [Candidatus Aenigmarchaeota archaeon]|nr:class I SAM-dependent methyltransferase [Candidatus Aenigmarchaeota archaeon]